MTEHENADLIEFLRDRERWPQPDNFVTLANFGEADPDVIRSLDVEIPDLYHDLTLRKIDMIDKQYRADRLREILLSPELEEYLALLPSNQDFETTDHLNTNRSYIVLQALKYKITKVHYIAPVCLWPRCIHQFRIFIEVEHRDGTPVEQARDKRNIMEAWFGNYVAKYISELPEFQGWEYEMQMDFLKMYCTADATNAFFIGFSYDERVPFTVIGNMFVRACETFFPNLLPLTYMFMTVTSETYVDLHQKRFYEPNWISFEKAVLLVIFFLQQCKLIPRVIRDTNVFISNFLTWETVYEWNKGVAFFPEEYYLQKKDEISRSPFVDKTVGELFVGLIHFYATTCPIGQFSYFLDLGKVGAIAENQLIPITTIVQWTCYYDTDGSYLVDFYHQMLMNMEEHMEKGEITGTVQNDLIDVRKKLTHQWDIYVKSPSPIIEKREAEASAVLRLLNEKNAFKQEPEQRPEHDPKQNMKQKPKRSLKQHLKQNQKHKEQCSGRNMNRNSKKDSGQSSGEHPETNKGQSSEVKPSQNPDPTTEQPKKNTWQKNKRKKKNNKWF